MSTEIQLSPTAHATLMGTVLALASLSVGMPIDNIKIRGQVAPALPYRQLIQDLYQKQGFRSFYAGTTAAFIQRGFKATAHTPMMIASNHMVENLSVGKFEKSLLSTAILTLMDTFVVNPTEAIKVRIMTRQAQYHLIEMLKELTPKHVWHDTIRGFGWTFSKTYLAWLSFNETRRLYKEITGEKQLSSNGLVISGALATAVKLTLTTPIDVVKTQLQQATQNETNVNGRTVIKYIVKEFGWRKLFRGLGPRAVHSFMAIVIGNISMDCYERERLNSDNNNKAPTPISSENAITPA